MPQPDRCPHGCTRAAVDAGYLCASCVIVTDAAKRAYDIVNAVVHYTDWSYRIRLWVALRLADGGSDGTLYESRREAVRHQAHEQQCAYFSYRGAPNGFASHKDAQLYLDYHRHAYDNGARLPDPDAPNGGPELIMPTPLEQVMLQRALLARRN